MINPKTFGKDNSFENLQFRLTFIKFVTPTVTYYTITAYHNLAKFAYPMLF